MIAEPCIDVKDGSCVDVCPVDCIKTVADAPMFYIDPHRCIDCRACALVCPVEAILSDYDPGERWDKYAAINAALFRS